MHPVLKFLIAVALLIAFVLSPLILAYGQSILLRSDATYGNK